MTIPQSEAPNGALVRRLRDDAQQLKGAPAAETLLAAAGVIDRLDAELASATREREASYARARDASEKFAQALASVRPAYTFVSGHGVASVLARDLAMADADIAALRRFLEHEVLPRYAELYAAAGLGDPAESVIAEPARALLASEHPGAELLAELDRLHAGELEQLKAEGDAQPFIHLMIQLREAAADSGYFKDGSAEQADALKGITVAQRAILAQRAALVAELERQRRGRRRAVAHALRYRAAALGVAVEVEFPADLLDRIIAESAARASADANRVLELALTWRTAVRNLNGVRAAETPLLAELDRIATVMAGAQ